jgi:hypothetical protein
VERVTNVEMKRCGGWESGGVERVVGGGGADSIL